MIAHIAGHDGGHPRRALGVLPHDLTRHRNAAAIGRPLVATNGAGRDESKSLFHVLGPRRFVVPVYVSSRTPEGTDDATKTEIERNRFRNQ